MTPAVRVQREGPVTTVLLSRPERRNAVDGATAAALADAFRKFDADAVAAVAVLHGEGGVFCAGADLKAAGSEEGNRVAANGDGPMGPTRMRLSKPVIAAIEGFAVAGGMELALSCDLIVAARGAKMGIPEAKRSIVAAGGALLRLPRRMPYHLVMELALTGDPFLAERFHELGLVNRLAEPGGAVDVAMELAETIGRNGPLSLAASKQILQEQFDWKSTEMWDKQLEISGPVLTSEDAKEGAAAFKEKRAPVWRGR
jgi:enoyl-CoA hydratase